MQAFILSGGFGTKLREFIYNQPKILAPIKNKAFIEYLISLLKKRDFNQITLGLGYLSGMVEDYVNSHEYNIDIKISIESRPLGTGGALKNAENIFTKPTFIINGDTYLDVNYKKILDYHQKNNAEITLVTAKNRYSAGFGRVKSFRSGKVTEITSQKIDKKGKYVNAGVYVINPQIIKNIPPKIKISFEKEILPKYIRTEKVFAYKTNKTFFDIGKSEGYKLARQKLSLK